MTITSTTIINSIHTKLDALLVAAGGSAIPYGIGGIDKSKYKNQSTSPQIVWYDHDIDGSFEPLKRSLTDRRRWAEDVDRYQVQIWAVGTDSLTAREVLQLTAHNLMVAARSEVGSEQGYGVETVRFGRYRKSRDGQTKRGIQMTLDVDIILNVTDDIWATVVCTFEGDGVILPSEESMYD